MSRESRKKAAAIVGLLTAAGAAYLVWLAGLDIPWAATTVLVILPLAALFAISAFAEPAPWAPPVREPPRGIRLTVTTIEQSLAACDRLARPPILRRLREISVAERDDKQARTVVRQMRALVLAELRDRKIDPDDAAQIDRIFGPDVVAILQTESSARITSATIARSLAAIERVATTPPPAP